MGLKERSYKYQLKCEVDGSEDPGDLEKKEKSSGCYTPEMLYRSTLEGKKCNMVSGKGILLATTFVAFILQH